jgi:hypothetical protein
MGHDRARAAYRRAAGVELRTRGYSYDEIAEVLEYRDRSGAWRAVAKALSDRQATAVDRLRMVRFAELEGEHRAAWEQAKNGDFKAIDRVMRCADERLSLLGVLD